MSGVLLLRQPRSGLPGLTKPDDRLLARVPVCGTQDAGRGFWKKFRRTLIAGGVRENRVLSAVYTLTVDGQLRGIVATHVVDLLCAFDGPVGQGVIDHIKKHLILSKESECNFSFCGREVRQDAENGDYSVLFACEATTLKINEIRFEGNHVHVRKMAQERLTASEQEQYESVTGSLQWVVRIARVESQAAVSKLQQMKKTSDGGNSCLREQGPPVSQEDYHSRFDVSDGSHQLAPGRFCDLQRLRANRRAVQKSGRTHDDPSDAQPREPGRMWFPFDSMHIKHAEAGLPFYSHSRDVPDGIGCRRRRSAASRDCGHV